jgi:Cdc6-like AAA superfamily ATPase
MAHKDAGKAGSDEAASGSGEEGALSPSQLLTNLEDTVARFSDGNVLMRSSGRDGTEEGLIQRYAPPGLEEPFRELHSIIAPSLVRAELGMADSVSSSSSSSSAAILMGTKGSGKSLLLDRVLAACMEQQRNHRGGGGGGGGGTADRYRMVTINGIICRGQDIATVVYEIVRQLSDLAFQSASTSGSTHRTATNEGDNNNVTEAQQEEAVRRKRQRTDKHLLRLRRSAFTSNLALLESTLQIADTDQVPVLIVLDELDSFTEEGERQLLLYHFLDRLATPGSNLIFIGITSSFSTLTLLEKRIRSRAEGTAKVIYLRPPPTYTDLLNILRHKLDDCLVSEDIMSRISRPSDGHYCPQTTSNVTTTTSLSLSEATSANTVLDTENVERVSLAMQREFRFGKDLRWFSRVIATALSLYRHDCVVCLDDPRKQIPNFRTSHLVDSLVMMGASISDTAAATKQPDLCVVHGLAVDPRLQALLDLSTPQVALLLAAKRILTRERHKDHVHEEEAGPPSLSLERILKEYESFRRGSSSQGNTRLLRRAAHGLLETGLLVPCMDHSGGGPNQSSLAKSYRNVDPHTLRRLPLQMSVETDRELGRALEDNLLECPTALKEWGRAVR